MEMSKIDVYDVLTRKRLFTYDAWDVPRANDRIFDGKDYVVIYTKFFTRLPYNVDMYVLGG